MNWIYLGLGVTFGFGLGLVVTTSPATRYLSLIAGNMVRIAGAMERTAESLAQVALALERTAHGQRTSRPTGPTAPGGRVVDNPGSPFGEPPTQRGGPL